jgi:hypothetical protein
MQTVYYSPMRKILAWVLIVAAGVCLLAKPAGAQGTAAQGTTGQATPLRTAILDSHEGVTIGVEPWTSPAQYKGKFPKKNPYTGGIVALHLTIRNDNDEPINLNRSRIRLLVQIDEENKQELQPLTGEDVADTVLLKQSGKDPTARHVPIPVPIPVGRAKPTRDKNWEDLKNDCQNAGLPSAVIGPHETMEGLVYFDLRGEWEMLKTARLYVPDLERMTTKQAISYFDIGFSQDSAN